jgi:hypothetical protein
MRHTEGQPTEVVCNWPPRGPTTPIDVREHATLGDFRQTLLLKLFQTKVADADAIKCAKLEDALELAEIFAKGGVNGLTENKRDGCDL